MINAAANPHFWEPSDKQALFLEAPEYEVLFGGAAGGGKSDALIIDALGLNREFEGGEVRHAIDNPKYRALLLRRSWPELVAIVDRARVLYEPFGARFVESKRWFVFPSGARIEFGYSERLSDARSRFKGFEYQWLGFEELTEHPTDDIYRYLISRLRGPAALPKYIRSTTNPDGPGNSWVKERFGIHDSGGAVEAFRDPKTGRTRRFIPSRVDDNPHIDPSYKTTLLGMSEQEQKALLLGRWDVVDIKGAIYKEQYSKALEEGRITTVPYDPAYPVYTVWDLGANDAMAIWFFQHISQQSRFIDYLEGRHLPIAHYVREMRETGYVLGTVYLPHDGDHQRLGQNDNRSVRQMLEDLDLNDIEIVPRVSSIRDGIEQTRQRWPSAVFDKVKCKRGLDGLKNYRWKYDERTNTPMMKPHHDWASNPADAFRQWAQGFQPSRTTFADHFSRHQEQQEQQELSEAARARAGLRNRRTNWIT